MTKRVDGHSLRLSLMSALAAMILIAGLLAGLQFRIQSKDFSIGEMATLTL